jgi:catechol 2,3-dioxygenase-like lactoylglutathione lyase family enzyme
MRMMHVNIGCSDFDRSYDFYTSVVGMKPVTGAVVRTGTDAAPADLSGLTKSGKRIGEHITDGADAEAGARVLGFSDRGTGHNRGVLLYWDEQPLGPYVDLQQFLDVPGERIERATNDHGLGRLAMFVDDLEPHLARLRQNDVKFVSQPQQVLVGTTNLSVVCFYDPDGTVLEYVQMVDGGWTT